jgi:hypothetical protein
VESAIEIVLETSAVEQAVRLAEDTYRRFEQVRGYYRNTVNSHLVGKLGEIGIEQFLQSRDCVVDSAFRDDQREGESDIVSNGNRIEIKTWTDAYWPQWGRCISVHQYAKILAKADIVGWMSVIQHSEDEAVCKFHGWNWVKEIEQQPKLWTGPQGKQVHNYQTASEAIRSPMSLVELLSESS